MRPLIRKYTFKFTAAILTLVLLLNTSMTALAAEEKPILNAKQLAILSEALHVVELQKEIWGIPDTDFNSLRLGKAIPMYEYINNTFEPEPLWDTYPLIDNNKLVLLATERTGEYSGRFQISTALVKELGQTLDYELPFAIVYDRNGVYLYANDQFTLLGSFREDDTRSVLDTSATIPQGLLETVSLSENTDFEYISYIAIAMELHRNNIDRLCKIFTASTEP